MREDGEVAILRKTNDLRRELQSQLENSMKVLKEKSELEESSGASLYQRRLDEVANRCVVVYIYMYVRVCMCVMRFNYHQWYLYIETCL